MSARIVQKWRGLRMRNFKMKLVGKTRQLQIRYQSRLVRFFRPLSTHIIHIDGGLGSQIMQYSLYSWLKNEGKAVALDASYFRNQTIKPRVNWVDVRPWRLDRYGHSLEDQRIKKGYRLRDKDFMHLYSESYSRILEDKQFLQYLFPLNLQEFLKSLYTHGTTLDQVRNSVVIHIRQGDFVTAASLLLPEDYYLDSLSIVLEKIGRTNTQIIIVSDQTLDSNRFPNLAALAEKNAQQYKVMIGGDEIFIHNLMRSCKALICSNSTFSFSAAMLKIEGVSVYPEKFYEGETAELNVLFKLESGIEMSNSRFK